MKPGYCRTRTLLLAVCSAGAVSPLHAASPRWHLRFLVEPGAEGSRAGAPPTREMPLTFAVVPGAAYLFATDANGAPEKRGRMPVEPAAAYGAAAEGGVVFVATRDGAVSRWSSTEGARATLRFWREVGERTASLTWAPPRVFVSTWSGKLLALSDTDGKTLWSADLGEKVEGGVLVDGERVYAATKGRALLSLDAVRGLVRFRVDLPGLAVHPPVLSTKTRDRLYCGTREGRVAAFDTRTGRALWTSRAPARLTSGPVAGAGMVAVAAEDGTVRGFEETTGTAAWEAAGAAKGAATLKVQSVDGKERLLCVSRVLAALDPATGARMATYPDDARTELKKRFGDAMLEGEKTYSEAEKRQIEEQEAFDIDGEVFGPARLNGAALTVGTEDGWVYLFDALRLRPVWRYRAAPPVAAGPVWADGRVLVGAGEDVLAIDAVQGQVAWRRPMSAEVEAVERSGETVGVVAGSRLAMLRAADGSFAARPPGRARALWPPPAPGGPWLVDDGEGTLRPLVSDTWTWGEPRPAPVDRAGTIVFADGWLTASGTGTLTALRAASPKIETAWEAAAGEPVTTLGASAGLAIVTAKNGGHIAFDPAAQKVAWRKRPVPGERWLLSPVGPFVWGGGELRRLHPATGEVGFTQKTGTPVVGAGRWNDTMAWIDAIGRVYAATDAAPGTPVLQAELGLLLEDADAVTEGFLLKTAAGEVGLLEAAGW